MNAADDADDGFARSNVRVCDWKQSSHHVVVLRVLILIAAILSPSASQAFVVSSSSLLSISTTKISIHSPSRQSIITSLLAQRDEKGSNDVKLLSHSDIEWRLRPPESTSRFKRWKIKLGAAILRLDCKLKGEKVPQVLCPRGGRALLEAYYKEPGQRKKKIARFGFTTARGPSSAEIDTTIKELYNINPPPLSASIAAIIYMFVEPAYRNYQVGSLALEVISAIQYVQAVDFTILVADDNGSGGLVRWYEEHGYARAPLLQNMLGSPNEVNGIAMISPVTIKPGFFDQCVIKWW